MSTHDREFEFHQERPDILEKEEREEAVIEHLLTKADAATVLAVSKRSVTRLILEGKLPALRIRGCWRIQPISLRAYLDEQERKTVRELAK